MLRHSRPLIGGSWQAAVCAPVARAVRSMYIKMLLRSATMEVTPPMTPETATSETDNWIQQLGQSLDQQRGCVREFLTSQQQRLQKAEAELADQLRQLTDQLTADRQETSRTRGDLQQQSEQIARETQALQSLRDELAARQADFQQLYEQSGQQQAALAEQIRQQQGQLDSRWEELTRRQAEIDEAHAQLQHDRQVLQLAQGEHDSVNKQLAADRKHVEEERAALQDRNAADDSALREELKTAQRRETQLTEEIRSLQSQCEKLQRDLAERPADGQGDSEELGRTMAECDMLRVQLKDTEGRLAETQQRLAEAPQGEPMGDEELQRRYETAMEDVRKLRQQNEQQQRKLDKAPASSDSAVSGGSLDWEAEKERILAALDAEDSGGTDEEDDEERAEERLNIQRVTERTDKILSEKKREIEELQQLLQDQSTNVGAVAIGAAALGEMLDSDAIVVEERENLKSLQVEWKDKLRKAEVDISMERAKIGRERVELEEKIRLLQEHGDAIDASKEGTDSNEPARGRWLEQLGLKNSSKESQ